MEEASSGLDGALEKLRASYPAHAIVVKEAFSELDAKAAQIWLFRAVYRCSKAGRKELSELLFRVFRELVRVSPPTTRFRDFCERAKAGPEPSEVALVYREGLGLARELRREPTATFRTAVTMLHLHNLAMRLGRPRSAAKFAEKGLRALGVDSPLRELAEALRAAKMASVPESDPTK